MVYELNVMRLSAEGEDRDATDLFPSRGAGAS